MTTLIDITAIKSPTAIGEALRNLCFMGRGLGGYNTFDLKPQFKPVDPTSDKGIALISLLAPCYDEDDYKEAASKGQILWSDGEIDVAWYWDGDGTLLFRTGGIAVVNRDCKKDHDWQFLDAGPDAGDEEIDEIGAAMNLLLETDYWPKGIEVNEAHSRIQDDAGGDPAQSVAAYFDLNGDAYLKMPGWNDLRFRTDFGGGKSPRVRKAIFLLAEAIRRDNEEFPQTGAETSPTALHGIPAAEKRIAAALGPLVTVKALADAHQIVSKAATKFWEEHLLGRFEACSTLAELNELRHQISFEAAGDDGQMRSLPADISVSITMMMSTHDLRARKKAGDGNG